MKSAAESPWTGSKEERPSTNTCSLNSAPDAFSAVSVPEKESRKVSPTTADAHGAPRVFPGPDSRFFLRRLRSGRLLLISNDSPCARERLSAFLSEDDGLSWPYRLLLDNRKQVSYPDAAESPAGTISLIYDCNRCNGGYIFLSQITEEDILAGSLVTPASFLGREVSHSRPVS